MATVDLVRPHPSPETRTDRLAQRHQPFLWKTFRQTTFMDPVPSARITGDGIQTLPSVAASIAHV